MKGIAELVRVQNPHNYLKSDDFSYERFTTSQNVALPGAFHDQAKLKSLGLVSPSIGHPTPTPPLLAVNRCLRAAQRIRVPSLWSLVNHFMHRSCACRMGRQCRACGLVRPVL